MADNVAITAGTGTTIAADDIAGVMHQRVKLGLGADGAATDAVGGAGAVSAAVQRVTLASDDPAVAALQGTLTVGNAGTFAVQATLAAGAATIAKAEDVASANADVGVPAMAVRKATPANTSDTDGDYEMLQMSAGRLWTSSTIDAALPAGTNAIGKLASNSGVTIGAVEIAANQTVATVTNVATIGTSVTPGTGAANLGKAEDAAHTTGDVGVMALSVRSNTAAATSGADGDYQPLITDTNGRLHVVASAGVAGDIAHDGIDSGNPLKVGARAIAHGANPSAVAAADRTDLFANRHGVLFVMGGHPNTKTATYITTGAQTDDNVLPAIATGTKYVLTRITITLDESTTVGTAVRLGWGATTVPALGASGADAVDSIIIYHPGMVPGGGITLGDGSGILAVGADGEELRITCEAPTSGTLVVSVSYYTIES